MPLSEQAVAALSRFYKRWVPCSICSECGKDPGSMDSTKPHALQIEYDNIKKDKSIKPSQKKNLLLEISKILNNSSRCCGSDFTIVYVDYFSMLYERWMHRYDNRILKFLNKPAIDDKTGRVLMPSIRQMYGGLEQYHDDDFMTIHTLFGLGDNMTGELIKIFREEDIRQVNQQEQAIQSSESTPSYENDFINWIENVA